MFPALLSRLYYLLIPQMDLCRCAVSLKRFEHKVIFETLRISDKMFVLFFSNSVYYTLWKKKKKKTPMDLDPFGLVMNVSALEGGGALQEARCRRRVAGGALQEASCRRRVGGGALEEARWRRRVEGGALR